jgi:hypothetical protein
MTDRKACEVEFPPCRECGGSVQPGASGPGGVCGRCAVRVVVGPGTMPLAPDFVTIDSYEKAVAHFGELGAQRYRVLFEEGPPVMFEVADEAPTTERNT